MTAAAELVDAAAAGQILLGEETGGSFADAPWPSRSRPNRAPPGGFVTSRANGRPLDR